MKKLILPILLLSATQSFAALESYSKQLSKTKVPFLKESGVSAEQFSAMPYNTKPDQALLEKIAPLYDTTKALLTPDDFKKMTQEELDQVYIRLGSGPIAPGDYRGSVMIKGNLATGVKNFILKKFRGVQVLGNVVCGSKDAFECFTEIAWEGKRIYPADKSTGEVQMRNAVSKGIALGIKTAMTPALKQIDPRNWLMKTLSPFDGGLKYMILPAHVYCGQSLLDHRKESIILDYSWGSDFSSIPGIDDLFGRDLMNMREEIRMVRPGLYLGRVYTQKIFLFSFVLHSPDVEKAAMKEAKWPANSCFDGKTTR